MWEPIFLLLFTFFGVFNFFTHLIPANIGVSWSAVPWSPQYGKVKLTHRGGLNTISPDCKLSNEHGSHNTFD